MADNMVQFKLDLLSHLFGLKQVASVDGNLVNLIRKHEKLPSTGDFSFPSLLNDKIWQGAVDQVKQKDENDFSAELIQASSTFALEIEKVLVDSTVVRIFLKRRVAFEVFFNSIQVCENLPGFPIKVINYEKLRIGASRMSVVRCDAVMGVIIRILKIYTFQSKSGIIIGISCSDPKHLLEQLKQEDQITIAMKVGHVMTAIKQKDKDTDVVNLVEEVEKEMKEVENQREAHAVEGSSKLLAAAHVQFGLLESTLSQPVVLGSKVEQSKIAFVLYNSARIRQIMRVFEEKVERGTYPQLPPRKDIDWGLLTEEDEWSLLFLYLMEYSGLVKSISCSVAKGELRIHKLCQFLLGLSGSFSRYYSRVRVLREPLPHLLPTLFARIHLLKAVDKVMHEALGLLDIQPVDRM